MNKKTKIIISIAVVIVVCIVIFYFYSKDEYKEPEETSYDKYYYENREKVNLEMGKYVESKDYVLKNGDILVEVSNKNDYAAQARIYIEFFDEKEESITMQDDYIDHIEPGKKAYQEINIGEELKKIYKTYKIKVVLSYDSLHRTYYDNVKFISLDEKKELLKFKNNTNKKLDGVIWGLLYYDDNNQIVAYSREYVWDVKKNKTVSERIYLENVEYSKIKVVLLEAYE